MRWLSLTFLTVAALVCLSGCAATQGKPVTEPKTGAPAGKEPGTVTPRERRYSPVYHQTQDHIWMWVHPTKSEDEFQQDATSCRGTPEVIDAYLSDADKEFMPLWMLPSAAFNKCMLSKGWTIDKREKTDEP